MILQIGERAIPLTNLHNRYATARRKRLIEQFEAAFALTSQSAKTMRFIIREVAAKHRLSEAEIFSDKRNRPIAHARQEAMFRCLDETKFSSVAIGRLLNRDHATVILGARAHVRRNGLSR